MRLADRRACLAPLLAALLALGCSAPERSTSSGADAESAAEPAGNARKQAYFGDLHIHSAWSLDAYAYGVRVMPEDAYRYARGEAIDHVSGQQIQATGPPLDFVALTEHANYLGFSEWLEDGSDPSAVPQLLRDLASPDAAVAGSAVGRLFLDMAVNKTVPEVLPSPATTANTWRRIVELADRNNRPGEFTAFVAYEYTPMPEGQNLHRNVIFRGSQVPERPYSSLESMNPEDLWDWMDAARGSGSDVLSIPHNQNGSNGRMYETVTYEGGAIDAAYATQRVRNEPVSEVMQIKGQSETHPELSPEDEWADFEISPVILGIPNSVGEVQGSYARRALRDGLAIEARTGVNPYRFGMLGSSDGHNASSPVEEPNYTGKIGALDGTPGARLERHRLWGGASGLTGVWAEENTREAIFDALRAREVFATSGPRLRVRLFGGWDFARDDLAVDMVEQGSERGVTMGAVLPARPGAASAPTLLVGALKDPNGAPLERLQVVKGWLAGGKTFEKVFDVACVDGAAPEAKTHRCAARAAEPNLDDCTFDAKAGRDELAAAWTDPEFDAGQPGFYYARVLEVPTCRWSTWDANRLGVARPDDVPAAIQERAVTSPVWHKP